MDYKEIETFEAVLKATGETLEQFQNRTIKMSPDAVGYEKVKLIVKAINGGKNVTSGYYPFFYNINRSLVGFRVFDFHETTDFAFVGSRLLMIDSERALFVGFTFCNEYSEYING